MQRKTLGSILPLKAVGMGRSSSSKMVLARSEFCELSLKYPASNLKRMQPIADLKIAT